MRLHKGTSVAAPFVTGTIACLYQVASARSSRRSSKP